MDTTAGVLDRWRNFPATANPRPIVLVDGYVRVQAAGFDDDAAKIAFHYGAVTAAAGVRVPASVLALLRGRGPGYPGPGLEIAAVETLDHPFRTDRGPALLPSYALTIPGARQPVIVLDPETPVWWPPAPLANPAGDGGSALIDADQRTLHVIAGGSVLTDFLRCDLVETDTAVMALPITRERPLRPGESMALVRLLRPVTGRLARPLGGRIVITAAGDPVTVERTDLPAADPRTGEQVRTV
jgi:hypothetical protein